MPPKILIYGYGNPGRQDDSLGILLAERLEAWVKEKKLGNISIDMNYQLNIEDAVTLSQNEIVFFADASKEPIASYALSQIVPSKDVNFTMHSVSPSYVLNLCEDFYGKSPQAYMLHIRGYQWEFMAEPTDEARSNLEQGILFLKNYIENIIINN